MCGGVGATFPGALGFPGGASAGSEPDASGDESGDNSILLTRRAWQNLLACRTRGNSDLRRHAVHLQQ